MYRCSRTCCLNPTLWYYINHRDIEIRESEEEFLGPRAEEIPMDNIDTMRIGNRTSLAKSKFESGSPNNRSSSPYNTRIVVGEDPNINPMIFTDVSFFHDVANSPSDMESKSANEEDGAETSSTVMESKSPEKLVFCTRMSQILDSKSIERKPLPGTSISQAIDSKSSDGEILPTSVSQMVDSKSIDGNASGTSVSQMRISKSMDGDVRTSVNQVMFSKYISHRTHPKQADDDGVTLFAQPPPNSLDQLMDSKSDDGDVLRGNDDNLDSLSADDFQKRPERVSRVTWSPRLTSYRDLGLIDSLAPRPPGQPPDRRSEPHPGVHGRSEKRRRRSSEWSDRSSHAHREAVSGTMKLIVLKERHTSGFFDFNSAL